MKVSELIKELLDADKDGDVKLCIQTREGWEYVDIESINVKRWGVEINSEIIDGV